MFFLGGFSFIVLFYTIAIKCVSDETLTYLPFATHLKKRLFQKYNERDSDSEDDYDDESEEDEESEEADDEEDKDIDKTKEVVNETTEITETKEVTNETNESDNGTDIEYDIIQKQEELIVDEQKKMQ
jgi:hypothetical protein